MTGKTITRADLTDAVYRALGISRNESATFVERILEEISSPSDRIEASVNWYVPLSDVTINCATHCAKET